MASKKAAIKFIVEEPITERSVLKSFNIPAASHDETEKEKRKSEISIRSNTSMPSDTSATRVRPTRGVSIFGLRGKDYRRRQSTAVPVRKQMTLQPTYQLGPLWPYEHSYVVQIMSQCVNRAFASYKYDVRTIDRMCQRTTIAMQKRVTGLEFNRYRNLCVVIAGEKFYQDLMIASGFLWDKELDVYDTFLLERPDFFVLAIVYGVYYD